jgi:hypothetical protein
MGNFFGGKFFASGFFGAIITGTQQLYVKIRSFTERKGMYGN